MQPSRVAMTAVTYRGIRSISFLMVSVGILFYSCCKCSRLTREILLPEHSEFVETVQGCTGPQ